MDKSRIISRILYDRVLPLTALDALSEQPNNPLALSSTGHFAQSYLELYTSAYSPAAPSFPYTPGQLSTAVDAAQNQFFTQPATTTAVIGPSMGGLISRYGLAQMERMYAAQSDPSSA